MAERKADWDGVLLLDAGDLFAAREVVPDTERQMALDRAKLFVEVYGLMGHDALGIGDRDLALGVPALLDLAKAAKFPFLASNLRKADGGPVFADRVVLERAGVKIGVFSLLTPEFPQRVAMETQNGIKVTDPVAAAQEQVAALTREGAQIVVCLAHLSKDEAVVLGGKVPGITAMLGTHTQEMLRYPERGGQAYIVDAFSKAKYLSALTLLIRKGGGPLEFVDPKRRQGLVEQISQTKLRIEAREKAIEQAKGESEGSNDPGRARNVEWLTSNLTELRTELSTLESELAALPKDDDSAQKGLVAYDLVSMAKTIADDPKIVALVDAIKEKHPALKIAGH